MSCAAEVLELLQKDGRGEGLGVTEGPQDEALLVPAAALHDLCRHLQQARHLSFEQCIMVTGTHMTEKSDKEGNVTRAEGFEVLYHLRSMHHHRLLPVKVVLPADAPVVDSVADVWPAADWHERETYDLVGITFTGHPNLKRILLPDDWEGHPLRKDYEFPTEYHGIDCTQ